MELEGSRGTRPAGLEDALVIAVLEAMSDSHKQKAARQSLIKGEIAHKQYRECKCGGISGGNLRRGSWDLL